MTHTFKANIELAPNDIREIEVECSCNGEYTYVYDDIYDALLDRLEEAYPAAYYPQAKITDFFILENENGEFKQYPVVANDSEKENNVKKYEKEYTKILILECYKYSLSDEMRLFMSLVEHKIIEAEYDEFDFDTYHEILEDVKICKSKKENANGWNNRK